MGVTFKEKGELERALETYNKALSLKPDFAEAYNNIGAFKEKGELERALEAIKALYIEPNYVEAYNNIGLVLQNQDRLEEAQSLQKALSQNRFCGSSQ